MSVKSGFDGGTVAGIPRHPDTVAKITATLRGKVPEVLPQPELKQCAKCREWKNTARDFHWYNRRLRSGIVRYAPYPRCLACERKRVAAYRARQTPEQRRAKDLRDRKARKRARERQSDRIFLNAEPLLRYSESHYSDLPAYLQRRIAEARSTGRIGFDTADRVCVAIGAPHAMRQLYGADLGGE